MVTPSIFKDVTLRISGSAGGKLTRLERFEQKIISTDFVLFSLRLFAVVSERPTESEALDGVGR